MLQKVQVHKKQLDYSTITSTYGYIAEFLTPTQTTL